MATQVFKTLPSPLKWQTRCLACFPDKTGFLLGSIEGRVAVHHVDDAVGVTQGKNFTFKCVSVHAIPVLCVARSADIFFHVMFHGRYDVTTTCRLCGGRCVSAKQCCSGTPP